MTVTSNANNNPNLKLIIEAQIQPIISVSERYLAFRASDGTKSKEILLSTLKKDLKIKSIVFKFLQHNGPTWQKDIPIAVKYEYHHQDSTTEDGFKVFKLTLFAPKTEETMNGEFIIDTNHPDKEEIKLRGRIDK